MPQQSINDKAFDNIAQKYCRYFDVQSPKQFTLEQWYRVIAEGTLELAYGKPAAKKKRSPCQLSFHGILNRPTHRQ